MIATLKSFFSLICLTLCLVSNPPILNAMEISDNQLDQEISRIEQALRFLGIKDEPVIITNGVQRFAQQILTHIDGIIKFETLNPDQKIKYADSLLDLAHGIKKGNESLLFNRPEVVIKLGITFLEKLNLGIQDSNLNECISLLKKLLSHPNKLGADQALIFLNSHYELMDEDDQDYYSMLYRFAQSKSLGKEVYKALLIQALNQTNKDLKLQYQDYCMMDLIHLWRRTCGQELSTLQKILMALTRVENATFSNLIAGNEPAILGTGFLTFVVVGTIGLLIAISIHTTQNLSMEPWGLIKDPLIAAVCMSGAVMILLMARNGAYYWVNKKID